MNSPVEVKMWIVFVAALIPMVIGFIWYNPKVFGTKWMAVSGVTEEQIKSGKMGLIFFLTYIFAVLISFTLLQMSVHQLGFQSLVMNYLQSGNQADIDAINTFYTNYGQDFRTFKHGAMHGFVAAFFFAFPLIGTVGLFERKSWSYILLHAGYWIISMTLMGGVVCQFG